MPNLALIVDGIVSQRIALERDVVRIGRGKNNDVQLDDPTVSSAHALIQRKANRYLDGAYDYELVDLGSTNATRVNGRRIERHHLVHDDQIRIGHSLFKFVDEASAPFEETAYILPDD